HPRPDDADHARRLEPPLGYLATVRMDMAVDREQRLEFANQAREGDEAHMRRVDSVSKPEWRRVGHEDVKLAPVAHATQPRPELELARAPSHLRLGVLVGAGFVANASSNPRVADSLDLDG